MGKYNCLFSDDVSVYVKNPTIYKEATRQIREFFRSQDTRSLYKKDYSSQ